MDVAMLRSILRKMGCEPERDSVLMSTLLHRLRLDGPPPGLTDDEAVFLTVITARPSQPQTGWAPKQRPSRGNPDRTPRSQCAKVKFRDLFLRQSSIGRKDLIKTMIDLCGCGYWTVMNYIALAKHLDNEFGIVIEERTKRDEQGAKTKVLVVLDEFTRPDLR